MDTDRTQVCKICKQYFYEDTGELVQELRLVFTSQIDNIYCKECHGDRERFREAP